MCARKKAADSAVVHQRASVMYTETRERAYKGICARGYEEICDRAYEVCDEENAGWKALQLEHELELGLELELAEKTENYCVQVAL